MKVTVGAALVAMALAAPGASAQIQQLPATSRSEGQANRLNNGLVEQGRDRSTSQQNQFEVNSLRNELSRPAAPVIAPPVVIVPR